MISFMLPVTVLAISNFSVYWNPAPDGVCDYCDTTQPSALHTDNEYQALAKYYSITPGCNSGDNTAASIFGHGKLIADSSDKTGAWNTLLTGQAYVDGAIAHKAPYTYYVCKYSCSAPVDNWFVAITNDPDTAYQTYYSQVESHGGAIIVNGSVIHQSDVNVWKCTVNPSCGSFNYMWCLGAYYEHLNRTAAAPSSADPSHQDMGAR